jgi:hypothetical protein
MRTVDTRWWMDDGGAQGIIKIKKDEPYPLKRVRLV